MKIATKGKGAEIKWVDEKDILDPLREHYNEEIDKLTDKIKEQSKTIEALTKELKQAKLSNIEIVKGLIER